MIAKGVIECPCCRRPFRAWLQAGVETVSCPTCWADVDTADIQLLPGPARPPWKKWHVMSALALIWDRLIGYTGGCPEELTL